jgi:hypothetical protein
MARHVSSECATAAAAFARRAGDADLTWLCSTTPELAAIVRAAATSNGCAVAAAALDLAAATGPHRDGASGAASPPRVAAAPRDPEVRRLVAWHAARREAQDDLAGRLERRIAADPAGALSALTTRLASHAAHKERWALSLLIRDASRAIADGLVGPRLAPAVAWIARAVDRDTLARCARSWPDEIAAAALAAARHVAPGAPDHVAAAALAAALAAGSDGHG